MSANIVPLQKIYPLPALTMGHNEYQCLIFWLKLGPIEISVYGVVDGYHTPLFLAHVDLKSGFKNLEIWDIF